MTLTRRKFLQAMAAGGAGVTAANNLVAAEPSDVSSVMFWDMSWGPDGYEAFARNLVDRFNRQNSGIKVAYKVFGWDNWPKIFDSALAAGTPPDVSTGGSYQAVQYYDGGHILDLDDVVAELRHSGQDKDFLPGTLERVRYKGHTVGLPWAIDIRVLLYRQDLFARAGLKPPATWNELRSAAKATTSGTRYGFVFPGNHIEGMQGVLTLMINNGGGLFSEDGKLDVMNPRNIEAATFISDLVKDGSVNPRSATFTLSDAHKEFLSGGGSMMVSTPSLEKEYPEQIDKIGLLAPVAGLHGDKATLSWVDNIMLYKSGNNAAAAKTFLTWWAANEKVLWTQARADSLPVRKSFLADPFFQSGPLTKRVIDEWVPLGKSTGARDRSMFPALNAVEGDMALRELLKDLLKGNEVITSMKKAEASLQKIT